MILSYSFFLMTVTVMMLLYIASRSKSYQLSKINGKTDPDLAKSCAQVKKGIRDKWLVK